MSFVVKDRVHCAVFGLPGTSNLTLVGAIAGFQDFTIVGNGNTCDICIYVVDGNGNPTGLWEVQKGSTYTTSGPTLSRSAGNVVDGSSGPGVLVNFSAGGSRVMLVTPSSLMPPSPFLAHLFVATAETTTSTTPVDLTTADTVTFTLDVAATVLVRYSANVSSTAVSANVSTLVVDTVNSITATTTTYSGGNTDPQVLTTEVALAAGSHTIKVKHNVSAGTGTWSNRELTIQRLP